MNATPFPYQINIRWSQPDNCYEASVPTMKVCLGHGDTPEEAVADFTAAAELWLESAKANGFPIPHPDATLERLSALAPILNLAAIAREAGIPPQTIATKFKRGTAFTEKEREALAGAFAGYGLDFGIGS